MGKKIIGLSYVSVGADCHDDVGDFSVVIAIVEFADAHITRGMTFRVVRRTLCMRTIGVFIAVNISLPVPQVFSKPPPAPP